MCQFSWTSWRDWTFYINIYQFFFKYLYFYWGRGQMFLYTNMIFIRNFVWDSVWMFTSIWFLNMSIFLVVWEIEDEYLHPLEFYTYFLGGPGLNVYIKMIFICANFLDRWDIYIFMNFTYTNFLSGIGVECFLAKISSHLTISFLEVHGFVRSARHVIQYIHNDFYVYQ